MKTITKYCRENRNKLTPAEKALKSWFLRQHISRFRTQRPFDFYIVDFLFPFKRIAVEVDGGYHGSTAQKAKDTKRTKYLEAKGLKVIRVSNEDVLTGNLYWLGELIRNTPDHRDVPWQKAYGMAAY